MSESAILIAKENENFYLKVEGKGNFILGHQLKEFYHSIKMKPTSQFYIDMKNCQTMDSTFMGVLAGIAMNFQNTTQDSINILNLSDHNYKLLNTLGIDIFLNLEVDQVPYPAQFNPLEQKLDKEEIKKNMLQAHQTLSQLSKENELKFQNVCDYLQSNIESN